MRFLIDEQISRKLVGWFEDKGHHAEHVEDVVGQGGGDRAIASYAEAYSAVIVSKDADFLKFLDGHGAVAFLWIRTGNGRTGALMEKLEAAWTDIEKALASAQRVVELN